jgi:hypothetical protein
MLSKLLQWGQTHYNVAFSNTSNVTSGISYDYTSGLLFSISYQKHCRPIVIKGKKEGNGRIIFEIQAVKFASA